ncbi:MAG: hypothetical protein J6K71_00300 [Clostridia bacterium]|nr:hypothetical protein [Clostridia bacterium]
MGAERNASLKIHKITNAFYLIIIIPFLILGFLSSLVMYNCKMAGGYPNLWGHYVVQIEDNSFYEEATKRYGVGTYQTFKRVDPNSLKPGDLIAYYSGHTEDFANGTAPDWVPIDPASSDNGTIVYKPSFTLASGSSDPTTNGKATVSIVKVGNYKGSITTDAGETYDCISYFSSNSAEEENYDYNTLLLTVDIIGVAVPSNELIVEFMVYSATFNGFFTFILIPCLFLVAMKIISLWFYRKYLSNVDFERRAQIITESENISYSRILNATKTGRFEKGPPKTRTPFWKTISAKISDKDAEKDLFGKKEQVRIKSIERLGKKSRKDNAYTDISEKELQGKRYMGQAPKPVVQKPQKEEKKAAVELDIKPIITEDYGKKSAKELRREEKRLRKLKEQELKEEFEKQKRQNLQEERLLDKEMANAEHALTKDLKKKQKTLKKEAKLAPVKKQNEYDRNIKIKENPLFKNAKKFDFEEEIASVNKAKNIANAEVDFFEEELKKSKEKLIAEIAKKPKGKVAKLASVEETSNNKPKWVDAPKMPSLETGKPEPVFKEPTKTQIELEENLEKRKNKAIAREKALLDKQLAKSKRKMLKSIKAGTAQDVVDAHMPPPKETVTIMENRLSIKKPTKEIEKTVGVPLMPEAKLQNKFDEERKLKAQKQAEIEKTFFDKLMEESQDKYLESVKREQEKRAKAAKQETKQPKPPKRTPPTLHAPKAPQKQEEELFIPGPAIKSIKGIKVPAKTAGPSTEDAIFNANKYDFLMDDGKKKSKREQKKEEKQRAQKAKKAAQAEAARNYFQQQLNKKK